MSNRMVTIHVGRRDKKLEDVLQKGFHKEEGPFVMALEKAFTRRSAAALVVSTIVVLAIFRYNLKFARSRSHMPSRCLRGSISPWSHPDPKWKLN